MHVYSHMPELYLYVGHGYLTDFCTRVHNFLSEKLYLTFSSAYYIDPQTSDIIHPDGPHVIPYGKGYLDSKEPHHQCYCPDIANPTDQYSDSNTKPTTQVTCSYDTKPTASRGITPPYKSRDFQIGTDLTYRDGMGKCVSGYQH